MLNLEVSNISYQVAEKHIVENINLNIAHGETIALLGHNGAGKSTILSIILGDFAPTAGSVSFGGKKFDEIKSSIGVVYDKLPSFGNLKVKEILNYFSSMYGINYQDQKELLELLGLNPFLNSFMNVLSRGERKKVILFLALMHKPEVLVLDEATSDLDPVMRDNLWKKVLKKYAKVILFTTHDWEEAEQYADKIAFLNQGKLVGEPDSPKNFLSQKYIHAEKKIILNKAEISQDTLKNEIYVEDDNVYHVFVADVKSFFLKWNGNTPSFSFAPKKLKDVYQFLTHA